MCTAILMGVIPGVAGLVSVAKATAEASGDKKMETIPALTWNATDITGGKLDINKTTDSETGEEQESISYAFKSHRDKEGRLNYKNYKDSVLSVTNQSASKGTLSFSCNIKAKGIRRDNATTVTVSNTSGDIVKSVAGVGPKDKESNWDNLSGSVIVNAGATVTLATINAAIYVDYYFGEAEITFHDITWEPEKKINVTFSPVPFKSGSTSERRGTYTVNGIDYSASGLPIENHLTTEPLKVTAEAKEGYIFAGWRWKAAEGDGGGKLTPDGSGNIYLAENCTVEPVFISDQPAVFHVDGEPYFYWEDAMKAAVQSSGRTVVLAKNYTLPTDITGESNNLPSSGGTYVKPNQDGTIQYLIPKGVTFLIPYDAAESAKEGYNKGGSGQGSPYLTLTAPKGTDIQVAQGATLILNAQNGSYSTRFMGCIVGDYGCMQLDGTMDVQGTLKARGIIKGSGAISAQTGSTVYQLLQIVDFRGGNATVDAKKANVFPFNQFYFQNIQVATTYSYGSSLYGYYYLYASKLSVADKALVIGNSGKPLFKMGEGSQIVMEYDAATARSDIRISGGAIETQSLTVEIWVLVPYEISTGDFECPFSGGFNVYIEDGGTVNITKAFKLLPGSKFVIEKGGVMNLESGGAFYLYDRDDYSNSYAYGSYRQKPFSAGSGTVSETGDGSLVVNGTLNINGGMIYTSASAERTHGGLQTTASTGIININNLGANTKIKEATQTSNKATSVDVNFYPLRGELAGADTWKAFPAKGTYYSNGSHWYNYAVNFYVDGTLKKTEYLVNTNTVTYASGTALDSYELGSGESATVTLSDNKQTVTVASLGQKETNVYLYTKQPIAQIITASGISGLKYVSLKDAVAAYEPEGKGYIQIIADSPNEPGFAIDKAVYLDLNGKTVTLNGTLSGSGTVYGMDSSVTDYTSTPKGKLTCSGWTVSTITESSPTGEYYVAIPNEDGSVSFHRYNIFVSGYRFELAAPECALFFIGKFQGDDAAKKYLTSLGFTLKDGKDTPLGTDSYSLPENPENIPEESNPGESPVVRDADGAYLFEVYLMRSFEKDKPATAYTEEITAIAQAMFKNNGTQDSEPQKLSFQKAWEDALKGSGMDEKDKAILRNFLNKFGIKIQAE